MEANQEEQAKLLTSNQPEVEACSKEQPKAKEEGEWGSAADEISKRREERLQRFRRDSPSSESLSSKKSKKDISGRRRHSRSSSADRNGKRKGKRLRSSSVSSEESRSRSRRDRRRSDRHRRSRSRSESSRSSFYVRREREEPTRQVRRWKHKPQESSRRNRVVSNDEFYLRYYVGHRGKFGHEFLEFELMPNGRLRYTNGSGYKDDSLIGKEMFVNPIVQEEVKRIVKQSGITKEDDRKWPKPNMVGKQELEVHIDGQHISFQTCKFGSMLEVKKSADPAGLGSLYYLSQDLKCLVMGLINMHFRMRPVI